MRTKLRQAVRMRGAAAILVLFLAPFFTGKSVAQTNVPPPAASSVPDVAEQVQIDLANGFFARDFYDMALAEYQKYLTWFPAGASVEEAMYRVAECQRGLGKMDDARNQFLAVQNAFPKGAFFARCGFRLGEMDWNQGRFEESLKYFKEAADRAADLETRLAGRFYQARVLLQLQRPQEAAAPLRDLARVEKQNPYRGFALMELARQAEAAGREDDARLLFGKVLETDSAKVLMAEAGMRAAALEMKGGRWSAAAAMLERIHKLDPAGDWMPWVRWKLARCYWQMDQYEQVLRLVGDGGNRFPKEAEAEVELLRAHALRLLRRYTEAAPAYAQFLKQHPGHPAAENVGYERLICLAAVDATSWEAEAAAFLKAWPQGKDAPQVLYLLADRAFRRKDFVAAAASYAAISLDQIPPSLAPEIVFRHGLSLAQAGRPKEAAAVFGDFLKRFPNHEFADSALYQRGVVQQQLGQWEAAAGSFLDLADRFPKAAEREDALYRIALLRGELRQFAAMREAFQRLLREYPKTASVSDAAYWTGWSLFEEKKYADAIPFLERARAAKPSEYGAQATSRLILARYELGQRIPLLKELDALPPAAAPLAPEIYDWLARQSAKEGDPAAAERYFQKLLVHPNAAPWRHDAQRGLATSLAAQGKWKEAVGAWNAWIKETSKPEEIIAGKLELVRAHTALKEYARAQELAEDVLRLQPEGRNNAQARLLLGEMLADQKKYGEAARYFLSVAVLYDDPEITPRALTRAIQSFESAGATNEVARLRQELKTKYPSYP